jgi:hypothetical protein
MAPFSKIIFALFLFVLIGIAGLFITDVSGDKLNQSILRANEQNIMNIASKSPEKFALLDMSTLDCRLMDLKGAVALFIPVLCYAKNKDSVEVDITELVETVAKEQSRK